VLDLVPENLGEEGLVECFGFVDFEGEQDGVMKKEGLEKALEENTPDNMAIMEDILENGGADASKEEIVDAMQQSTNLKKLKGRVVENPFISVLTAPPINMDRLDAKFISALFQGDPSAFVEKIGGMMPPVDKLVKVKKAIVGNDIDLPHVLGEVEQPFKAFQKAFARPVLDLVPEQLVTEGLQECFNFIDSITEKTETIKRAELQDCLGDYTPENEKIAEDIIEHGTKASKEDIIAAVREIPCLKELKGKVQVRALIDALTDKPILMSRLDAKFIAAMNKDAM